MTTTPPPYSEKQRIWDAAAEMGSPFATIGATPVSILGGFSLTTMVAMAARALTGWTEAGILLFAIAVVSFIMALLFLFELGVYNVPPTERIGRTPEAKYAPEAFKIERQLQWRQERLVDKYSTRAAWATGLGMSSALAGAGCALLSIVERSNVALASAALLFLGALIVLARLIGIPPKIFGLFPKVDESVQAPDLPPGDRHTWL